AGAGRSETGRAQDDGAQADRTSLQRCGFREHQGCGDRPDRDGCGHRLSAIPRQEVSGGEPMISGILTAFLLVMFIGLIFWAWSKRRKKDFDEASQLPLEDDKKPESRK